MHELAVTESILDIALKYAQQAQATRVSDLYLVMGRLASIVDDSVQFYWEILTEGTLCAGSKLHFKRVPAQIICLECGKEYLLDGDLEPCPACGSAKIKVASGDQFFLDSIEIEK
jgi:hydrogenase nickel incorporation protein HypA/HybF